MSTTVEALVSACLDELRAARRIEPFVQQAEDAGYPGLARLFRAMVISETAREALMRRGLVYHGTRLDDIFVCPNCGLLYDYERPERCVVDETPGAELIEVK